MKKVIISILSIIIFTNIGFAQPLMDMVLVEDGDDYILKTDNSIIETNVKEEKRVVKNDSKEIKQIRFSKTKSSNVIIENKPRENKKSKPMISILEKSVYIDTSNYVVELINKAKNTKHTFVIKGTDILSIGINGDAKIEANKKKITVILSRGNISSLNFNGGNLNKKNIKDDIWQICSHYNNEMEHFQQCKPGSKKIYYYSGSKKIGFCCPDNLNSSNEVKEYLRDLRVLYKIGNQTDLITYYEDIILTESGIGFKFYKDINKLPFIGKKIKTNDVFLTWNDFIRFDFKEGNSNKIIAKNTLTEDEFYILKECGSDNSGFNSWEFTQFLNDLKNNILNKVKPID